MAFVTFSLRPMCRTKVFFSFSFSFSLSLSNQPNFFQKDIPQDFFESSSDEEDADQPDERITRKSRFSRPPLGAIVNPAAVVFWQCFFASQRQ